MKRMMTLGLILLAVGCGGGEGEDMTTWTKIESGLKYFDVKEGSGPAAKAGQTVTVHYTTRASSTSPACR